MRTALIILVPLGMNILPSSLHWAILYTSGLSWSMFPSIQSICLHFIFIMCNLLFTENLSRRNSTVLSLSSHFQTQNATLANDGNYSTIGSHCSQTNTNKTIAWLQVDLGVSYSISEVKMYYRKEGELLITHRYQLERRIPTSTT